MVRPFLLKLVGAEMLARPDVVHWDDRDDLLNMYPRTAGTGGRKAETGKRNGVFSCRSPRCFWNSVRIYEFPGVGSAVGTGFSKSSHRLRRISGKVARGRISSAPKTSPAPYLPSENSKRSTSSSAG